MTDIAQAAKYLNEHGIEAFEGSNILVIPCDGPDFLLELASSVKKHLEDVGYEKSWQINPYWYAEHKEESQ